MSIALGTMRLVLLRACALGAIVSAFLLPATSQLAPTAAAPAGSTAQAVTGPVPVLLGLGADAVPRYRLPAGAVPTPLEAGAAPLLADYSLTIGGRSRSYRVFVPADLSGPTPLLVALGGLASRADPDLYMQWRALAQRKHFMVLEPNGYGQSWNVGRCCGLAGRLHVDDVDAVSQMIASVGHLHAIDRRRVYLVGFSNGGMLAYEFACRRPGEVAGVGVVAAAYLTDCVPHRAVPLMQVHGTADHVLPFAGGYSSLLGMAVPPTRVSDAAFIALDHRSRVPVETVHLTGVDHAWPQRDDPGGYDTTGALYAFLWAVRSP